MNAAIKDDLLNRTRATVLVVHTQVLPRNLLGDYLRACGYHVFEAKDFEEAEVVLGKFFETVDVVLSDAHSGFAITHWVRKHQPQLNVIVAPHLERSAEAAAELCDRGPNKKRPYEPQLLVDVIRQALARAGH